MQHVLHGPSWLLCRHCQGHGHAGVAGKNNQHAAGPGRYLVRCFVADCWRAVAVDDRLPVDALGRPLLVGALPLQLWPLLLTKAIFRLMAAINVRAPSFCIHSPLVRLIDNCLTL